MKLCLVKDSRRYTVEVNHKTAQFIKELAQESVFYRIVDKSIK
jgi:hypothetical protein